MNLGLILLIALIVVLVGGAPAWGYHNYGWYPAGGGAGLILLILLVLLLAGRL